MIASFAVAFKSLFPDVRNMRSPAVGDQMNVTKSRTIMHCQRNKKTSVDGPAPHLDESIDIGP